MKCKSCDNQFNYWKILRTWWSFPKSGEEWRHGHIYVCSSCQESHVVSPLGNTLMKIPLLTFILIMIMFKPTGMTILYFILILLILSILQPLFFLRVKDAEDSMKYLYTALADCYSSLVIIVVCLILTLIYPEEKYLGFIVAFYAFILIWPIMHSIKKYLSAKDIQAK